MKAKVFNLTLTFVHIGTHSSLRLWAVGSPAAF